MNGVAATEVEHTDIASLTLEDLLEEAARDNIQAAIVRA